VSPITVIGRARGSKEALWCALVTRPCDVLILAAFHPELAPLRSVLGEALRAHVGRAQVAACAVGIGLPVSAAATAAHLGELRPAAVLAIGTCGAYPGTALQIGQVVVARRIRLADASALRGHSQFPEPMSITVDAPPHLVDALTRATGAPAVDVATTLAITVDDPTAERIAHATGAQVEHLECYGVATACAMRGVAFGALLAVANMVGAQARTQWRIHQKEAAQAAADAAIRWLRREEA
jgi:nucleoside phosphorylase